MYHSPTPCWPCVFGKEQWRSCRIWPVAVTPADIASDVVASDVIVPTELRENYRDALEARPTPRKRGTNTRAQAGVATGSGAAKS